MSLEKNRHKKGVRITPRNLRRMKARMNKFAVVRNEDIAIYMSVTTRCIENWLTDVGKGNHRTMTDEQFLKFKQLHREIVFK